MPPMVTQRRASSLDLDGFADRAFALQAEIRGERRIPSNVADAICATLGGVMRDIRCSLDRPLSRVDGAAARHA